MARNIAAGIDVGTHQIKVVVAEWLPNQQSDFPKIIGTGFAESRGLRQGYIFNTPDVTESVKAALAQAEKSSGVKIKRAFLSLGGVGLEAVIGIGNVLVSRGDSEVTTLDVEKVTQAARTALPASTTLNRKIIHTVPLTYKVDGKDVLGGRPAGLKGMRLEAKVFFVTTLEQHFENLVEAVEEAGVEIDDAMAAPLAASLVSLTKQQKMAGCVLTNIGAETVSIIVFENGLPVSLEIFPIGSRDITNDIALGLRISLEEAERIKLGAITGANFSKKKYEEITSARLSDIFELVEAHLKKIGRNGLLPAGIVITGGGSGLATVEDLARAYLKLPSKISLVNVPHPIRNQVKDASWSVAYGLCIWGFSGDSAGERPYGEIGSLSKKFVRALGNIIRPLLP
jgi:cell division protein FtsA